MRHHTRPAGGGGRVATKKYEDIMGEWGFNAIFEKYLMVYFMDLGVNQQ